MKRILLVWGLLSVLLVTVSSCSSMKKDCRGNRHYRLNNGIYL